MFTFNGFGNDFFRSLVITLPDHGVMQFCQEGIFQSNSSFLLKVFKGISVIMLSKVFEAETNGFSLTILKRKISYTKIQKSNFTGPKVLQDSRTPL